MEFWHISFEMYLSNSIHIPGYIHFLYLYAWCERVLGMLKLYVDVQCQGTSIGIRSHKAFCVREFILAS